MDAIAQDPRKSDLAANSGSFLIGWGLPIVMLVVGGSLDLEAYSYPIGLSWMGVACLVNASRCGRTHCFITGPYFLALAAVSLVASLEIVSLGAAGWNWIGGAALIGGVALTCLPDMVLGRYRVWEKYRSR